MAEPARGSVHPLLIVGAMLLLQSAPAAGEPYPAEPAALFRHLCAACHGPGGAGDGPNAEHLDPRPADLTDPEYMATATEQDLFKVIEGGGRALEITPAMPAWGRTLSRAQIKSLVAYVQSLFTAEAPRPPVSRRGPGPGSGPGPGDSARCWTCHAMRGESRPIAPDLAAAGSKLRRDWLLAFLRNPPRIRPVGYLPLTKSRMPNFQFTEAEAKAVTDYLMTKKDPTLARAGSSPAIGEVRVTPELVARGRRLFEEEYACDACHRVGEHGGIVGPDLTGAGRRLQPQWIIQWLKRPQAIRSDSPMPDLGLSDGEARSLTAYLLSLEAARSPGPAGAAPSPAPELVKKGETLVKEKNCLGCHTMGSSGEPRAGSGARRQAG